ncbi:MAG: hypothetical protein J3Q66DRAFT_428170 [Benniella sp.]|nr:MAG: hypothetical protein J3Q66DRAFT_428170 [Benniella sp.]
MSSENPLEIPEITSIVASSLASNDLASCLRVSRKWLALFLPHRWKSIKVGSTRSLVGTGKPFLRFGPHPADIHRHRHLIQSLTMLGDLAGLDKYNYPNLRHLVVNYSDAEDPTRTIFLDLVEMFPQVVALDLSSVKIERTTWLILSNHSHITTLMLYDIDIKSNVASEFWEACTKLECLELRVVAFEGGTVPHDVMFVRLTKLVLWNTIGVDKAEQLSLIFHCPALKYFQWGTFSENNEYDTDDDGTDDDEGDTHPIITDPIITNPIPDGFWPHLNNLMINVHLHDTDVASMLKGVGREHGGLIELNLYDCSFLDHSSRALELHFSTLVCLSFVNFSVPSAVIRDILCSCPRLEDLSAWCVRVRDIVDCGPWVCQQLRRLATCFRLQGGEQDLQHDLFERLSRLTHLESLTMHCIASATHSKDYFVAFRLENGLGQLASLQQLKTLTFGGCSPQLSMKEVAWFKVHWTKLRMKGGPFHQEKQENDNLKAAMKLLGLLDV